MSDNLKIQGEVSLDTTNADQALVKVEKGASRMAEAVGNAGKKAGTGLSEIGNGGDASAAKVDKSTKSIVASIQRATALMEAGSKTSTKYYEALANQRGVSVDALRPYLDQLEKVNQSQVKVGISAKQTAAAMRNVPAQFTDIITSLQGGQAPLTVFLQQGGQLKDMFGGAGNAAKALGGYVAGLVNPFTIAAAAATALGAAYYYGNEQSKALQKSLIVSGNYAGTTSAKLNEVAEKVGLITGKFSESREAVTLLAESGKFSFESIQKLSQSIVSASSVTGKSIGETISQFEKLKGDPAKAILELNQQYNFLTADIYKQIKALEERGEKERAGYEAIKAYSESVNLKQGKIVENLGYIEKAWRGIKSETLGAIDTFLSFGRAADDAQKLAVAKNQLQSMRQTAGNVSKDSLAAKEIAEQEQLIKTIESRMAAEAKASAADGVASQQRKAATEQIAVYDDYLKKNTETLKATAKATAENDFNAATKGLSKTSEEYKKAFEIKQAIDKKIDEQFKEKKVAIAKEESAYKSLAKTIGEKLALSELELRSGVNLTEGQKLKVKLNELEQQSNGKLAKSEIEKQKARLLMLDANLRDIDYSKKIVEEHVNLIKSMDLETDSIKKQVESQNEYNAKIGLTKEAIAELEIAKLNDIAAGKDQNAQMLEAIGLETDLIESLREQAKQYRDLANAKAIGSQKTQEDDIKKIEIEQAKKALNELERESKRFYDDLYNGLSDSLYRGFESGKGFFQSFWDGIKNLFKTTVLKLAVQGVMTGVLGLGAVGQAGAAQSNPLGQAFDAISTGKSIWEGFSTAGASFTSSISSGITSLANLTGSNGGFLSSIAGGMNGAGVGSGLQSSLGLSIGQGAASVTSMMPYVAAAVAAFQGVKAINGDYRIGGLSADAGALLGIAPRLFGMKEKELGGQTVTGTLGTDNLMRNQSWTQDGGLFRSDRSGVWSYGLKDSTAIQDGKAYTDTASIKSDQILLKILNSGYDVVKSASTEFAKALGLNAEEIAKRNDTLNLTLGKTSEENDKAISAVFSGIADSIAVDLIPGIKSLQKEGETSAATMARLAGSLVSVNEVLGQNGFTKFAQTLEGGNAAARLAELTGGIEKLSTGAQYFFENFLTEAEKIKPSADLVTETMKRLGQSSVDTMEEFKLLVQGLDLATESGAKMYAELIAIAPQFKAVADYTKETVKASETYVDVQFNAQRKVEAAAIAATQALEAQARATMELAKAEKQKTYDDALQSRLRSGKIGEIMSSNYELNPVDFGKYVSAGQFDAAGFNSEILRQQAKLSLELIAKASADAINIEDVASVVGGLFDFTKGDEFRQILRQQLPQGTGLANDVGYVMFDFIESALEGIRLDKYAASGQGVINVINARDQIGYQADLLTQYNRSLSSAAEALRLGIVTQDEYTGAIAKANEILKDQVKTQDELATSLKQAGIDSIAFYFDQIGLSMERLNQAAEKAAEPLAVVTSAIGRFTSISDVFSLSANAAGDVGGNADLVAQSAKIAAQVLTTQSAAQAAKELAAKASFSGQSASQLRDLSLLIEGVKQFDPNSFEAGFLRISDALNKGTIDQAQYQDLFSASLNMFNGVESESTLLAKTMGDLRASMRGFADSLLIDKSKTTLSDSARMQEVMRQYDAAKIGAMTGDASSISLFQSLGSQLASKENYSSRAEANYGFSRVLADSEMLVRYADQKTTGEKQIAAIQNLEKSSNERMDRQFAILLAQLKELQDSNVNQVRAGLPA